MASPLRGRLMVGRLTLDQVVKVRVLAPQSRKTPLRRGFVIWRMGSNSGLANRLQTSAPSLGAVARQPSCEGCQDRHERLRRSTAQRRGPRCRTQTARGQGSTRMPLHLQQRPIWLVFQDGVLPDRQRDCLDAAFVAALTQELAILAVQLTDLEDSIVHFSHQQRMLRPARPLPRPLHAPLRGRRTVLLRQ
jgi:hypothetical protein